VRFGVVEGLEAEAELGCHLFPVFFGVPPWEVAAVGALVAFGGGEYEKETTEFAPELEEVVEESGKVVGGEPVVLCGAPAGFDFGPIVVDGGGDERPNREPGLADGDRSGHPVVSDDEIRV
jgi:hypothetical protein